MHPVLELPGRPDTPEARRAGDRALVAGVLLAALVVALAAVLLGRGSAVPRPGSSARLPVTASSPAAAAAWDGAQVTSAGVVVATGAENGRVATLRGGDGWRDYTLRTRVRWMAGREAGLVVRAAAWDAYVACVLDGTRARIDEVRAGVTRTLATAEVPDYRGEAFDAVVTVSGRRVTFALDGALAVRAQLRSSSRGSAGLTVSDPAWHAARLVAEFVRVERVTAPQPASSAPKGIRPAAEPAGQEE